MTWSEQGGTDKDWRDSWTWSQDIRILSSALSLISSVTLDKSRSLSDLSVK